ncbi:DUF6098 family protein [Streptomyces sp. NPDC029044]|uniref:DUF6098 family protein n=1 Tax=Streptomyces sp. NPDC029044 TaxID=3157198 RepID=UPI0033CFA828
MVGSSSRRSGSAASLTPAGCPHRPEPSGPSAGPLGVEEWWQDRPVRVRVARRLHDYAHLPHDKGPGVHPWVLAGKEAARGPDNEPLVTDVRPLCRIDRRVIDEAKAEVARQQNPWGPLRRS